MEDVLKADTKSLHIPQQAIVKGLQIMDKLHQQIDTLIPITTILVHIGMYIMVKSNNIVR